ncbi:Zn-dependent protease with chaperone function [Nocardia tenerifensis]|uniref:Zn-dependent protease with chaperone function n=1 Tax=Nocardia tenerifensis TaxID=228006 RepID=A0A318JVP8_9NOCA|nr:M48 family metallopeptidase [Nocardia tenerifensis]PXX59835.1 Zn-dependent protease with chaperone function [Nocardia tenerifensis]
MQPHEPQPHRTGPHVDPYGWAQAQDAPYGSPPPYPTPQQYGPYPGAPVPPNVPPTQQPRGLSPFGMPARHSWEIPMLIVVVLLTVLAYAFALLLLILGNFFNQYVLILVSAPLLIWLGRGMLYSTQRVNGVKMSPTQFPEGYQMVVEAAARFGMTKVPDAYVVLGNGQINAFASGHGFRRFVAVYSDLFEIGGAAREPDALAFIIGHEVGHIAAGHASYWRQLGMFLVPFLPLIGNSLIRAQEYTADNHGYCNRHTGAPAAMGTLAAGKYLNTLVGFDEMADRAALEKGFFVWVVNAMSSHPVLTWRMWALRDRSRHGKLWLRPSPPSGAVPTGYPTGYQAPALPPKPVP